MTVDEAHGPRNTMAVFGKGVIVLVITALPVLLTSREPLLIAALGGMAAVLLAPFASTAFVLFLSLSLGLVTLLSEFPLPGPGFRLYGSDLVLYFLILCGFTLFLQRARAGRPVLERRLLLLVGLMTAFGAIELGRGLLVKHFEMNDAAGDFRRLFIYPLAMVVPLLLPMGERQCRLVKIAIVGGALLVVATGAYRLATGQSFHADYFTETEYDPRLLSSTETVTLEMALAYLTAVAVAGAGRMRRMAALALGAVCAAFMVVSGWRLAALFIVISPAIAVILMGRMRKRRLAGLLILALTVILVGVGSVAVLVMAAPETFARAVHQYQERLNTFDIGHDMRLWAWKQAMEQWVEQPILGTGLGHQMVVYFRSSSGEFLGARATVHNIALIMLYKTGIVGMILFIGLHGTVIWYFFTRMRTLLPEYRAAAVGLFAGYVSSVTTHSLEPFENAGIVSLYAMIGFLLVLLRDRENHDKARELTPIPESSGPQEDATGGAVWGR